jgi:hypothetical protein
MTTRSLIIRKHFEYLEVHWDFNSQSGSPLGSVWVHSLTLSYTPVNMKCDSRASFSIHTLQAFALVTSLRLGSWQLDFEGPIKLVGNKYIFITTDYVTKWVEVKTLITNIVAVIKKILCECILTKFGCPLIIVTDQGVHVINDDIKYFTYHFLLKHVSSTTYYPQGNG